MKAQVALLLLVVVYTLGAPTVLVPHVATQYHAQDELGQYTYGYSGGPSAKHEEKTADGTTRGGYSYVDSNGLVQSAVYVSDTVNGFRVAATNLPVGPAVPDKSEAVVAETSVSVVPVQSVVPEAPVSVVSVQNVPEAPVSVVSVQNVPEAPVSVVSVQNVPEAPVSVVSVQNVPEAPLSVVSVQNVPEAPVSVVSSAETVPEVTNEEKPEVSEEVEEKSEEPVENDSEAVEVQSINVKEAPQSQSVQAPVPVLAPAPVPVSSVLAPAPVPLLTSQVPVSSVLSPAPIVPIPSVKTVEAVSSPVAVPVHIASQYHAQNELGEYVYGYNGGPSAKHEEKSADGITKGGYSYVDAHGVVQNAVYVSDPVGGFRVAASNIPQQPAPAYIQDSPEVEEAKQKLFKAQAEHIAKLAQS